MIASPGLAIFFDGTQKMGGGMWLDPATFQISLPIPDPE
jgi:hypothetical protein